MPDVPYIVLVFLSTIYGVVFLLRIVRAMKVQKGGIILFVAMKNDFQGHI